MNYTTSHIIFRNIFVYFFLVFAVLFPPFFSFLMSSLSECRRFENQKKIKIKNNNQNEISQLSILASFLFYILFFIHLFFFFFAILQSNSVWIYLVVDWISLLDFRRTNNYILATLWSQCVPFPTEIWSGWKQSNETTTTKIFEESKKIYYLFISCQIKRLLFFLCFAFWCCYVGHRWNCTQVWKADVFSHIVIVGEWFKFQFEFFSFFPYIFLHWIAHDETQTRAPYACMPVRMHGTFRNTCYLLIVLCVLCRKVKWPSTDWMVLKIK